MQVGIDIFTPVITSTQVPGWNVNLVATPDIAIAPGSSRHLQSELRTGDCTIK